MGDNIKLYDLEERTSKFGEEVIKLCKTLPYNIIITQIITQLIRSGTSIGANYREANGASSNRDFRHKIYLCKKETQETYHWLRMLIQCEPLRIQEIQKLLKEVHELTLIFGKILVTLKYR